MIKIIFLLFFSYSFAVASEINLDEVVKSSLQHYPKILGYYQKVAEDEAKIIKTQGLFDIQLKQQYLNKTKGFYDGQSVDIVLERQNQLFGSKFYAGYRKSYGDFAIYDGNYLTNSGGEYRVGASLPLLQNNQIDKNRLTLANAKLDLQQSKLQLAKMQAEIVRDASKAYFDWLATGKIYQIYQDLYDLALHRHQQLQSRLNKGDIANIVVVENQRNILSRKNSALEAKQDFLNQSNYLSLFLRDSSGKPKQISEKMLPKHLQEHLKQIKQPSLEKDITHALQNRPEMQILNIAKNKEKNNIKQAKNNLMPKLDASFEVSQDLGNGPQSRKQANNQIKLDFQLPLQQNEAKGDLAINEAKLSYLDYELQLMQEKIKIEVEQVVNYLYTLNQIYENSNEELKLSHKLNIAEKEHFKQGGSDFFLINLREQEVARADIGRIKSFAKYQNALADYHFIVFNNNQI